MKKKKAYIIISVLVCIIVGLSICVWYYWDESGSYKRLWLESYEKHKPSYSLEQKSQNNNVNNNAIVGTYEVKDVMKQIWVFTLNEDETATVSKKGSELVLYGSWEDTSGYNGGIELTFSDEPRIVFPSFDEGFYGVSGYFKDGYLYYGYMDVESKNPNKRLLVKKTSKQ